MPEQQGPSSLTGRREGGTEVTGRGGCHPGRAQLSEPGTAEGGGGRAGEGTNGSAGEGRERKRLGTAPLPGKGCRGGMEPVLGEVSRCWEAAKGNNHVQEAEQVQGLLKRGGPGIFQDEVWSQH